MYSTGKASVFVEPTSEGGHYSVGYPVVPLNLREDMLISTVVFLACFFHMFNLVKNVDVVELQWRCS